MVVPLPLQQTPYLATKLWIYKEAPLYFYIFFTLLVTTVGNKNKAYCLLMYLLFPFPHIGRMHVSLKKIRGGLRHDDKLKKASKVHPFLKTVYSLHCALLTCKGCCILFTKFCQSKMGSSLDIKGMHIFFVKKYLTIVVP